MLDTEQQQVQVKIENHGTAMVGERAIAAIRDDALEHLEWALARVREIMDGVDLLDLEQLKDLRAKLALATDDAGALVALAPIPDEDE